MMDDSDLGNLDDAECDTFNDETFGDIAEYNWEESNLQTKENILDENKFFSTNKDEWEDEFDAVEEEMEANVSKLLLDDMDDCEAQGDNDKTSSLFYAPPQILDRKVYFGGAPAAWLDEAESDDRNSLLGSSVWAMGSAVQSQLNQNSKPDQRSQVENNPEKPKARPLNLQELEEEFFKENEALSRKKPAKVIRAEDLERELKEQSSNVQRLQQLPWELHRPQLVEMVPPLPHNLNAVRGPFNNAFPGPGVQRFDPIYAKQVLREHRYAQDFNRNPRMFTHDDMRHKMNPNMLPQYIPNMPFPPRMYIMPGRLESPSFNGLMTDREKQRIRNIQIIQLQNDHPHKNDFYYQMYLIRSNPFNKDLRDRALGKLYPKETEQANKMDYKPVQFDKSLGKIQVASAQAPKKIFDIDFDKAKLPAVSQQLPGYHRMTLVAIEQGFKCLQVVEDLIIKVKVANSVEPDQQYEDHLYTSRMFVFNALMNDNLPRILNYRKGRVLIFKVLPRLEVDQSVQLLATMLGYFNGWTKTVETDTDYSIVLKTMLSVVLDLNAKNALALTGMLEEDEVLNLLQSRLGLSIYNILAYVLDRHRSSLKEKHQRWEKYTTCTDKIDWTIIPCVLTPKYIDEMMKMSINKAKSVQDGRLSFEEWAKMENSVYIRRYESPETLGLFGFPRDIGKFWQSTNVLWIDDEMTPHP